MGSKGIVASSAALGILLQEGIGDTIRISLTPEPGGDRTLEVQVAQELLQTMGFRTFVPLVAACPGCGRTTSTTFQELARSIQDFIREEMPGWKTQYPGVEALNVAVMGCIVNGPGESKHANIGISLPGTGEAPAAPVFVDGKKFRTLRGPTIAADFKALVIDYIDQRYGAGSKAPARYGGGVTHQSSPRRRDDRHNGNLAQLCVTRFPLIRALRWLGYESIKNDREDVHELAVRQAGTPLSAHRRREPNPTRPSASRN